MPDGAVVNEESMGSFQEWARSNNLTQEAAQAGLDLAVSMQQAQAQQFAESIKAQIAQWGEEAKADKEFGGEKFAQNKAIARRALDQFGTPALKRLLSESGLGNHPEILRAFYRAGQAISQDTFVPGHTGGARKSDAEVFYGGKPN